MDKSAGLIAERQAFYSTLRDLPSSDWDSASLCRGWRVRDVAAHINVLAGLTLASLGAGLVLARGDFDRYMNRAVAKQARRPVSEQLGLLGEVAASDRIPPATTIANSALDVYVHHHDVAIPLGRDVVSDPGRLRWMADAMVSVGRPIGGAARVKGLRLIATDIDWHYGTGPEVRGPAAALLLAGCGRTALNGQLEGDGVSLLQERGG